jgi:hypothetical protein
MIHGMDIVMDSPTADRATDAASDRTGDRMEDLVLGITREVQQSFARLIGQLPGRVIRASHLQKCLEIDSKVAWQVFKIAKAQDPLEAVRYMPSMVSIKRVVAAAKGKGVSSEVLTAMEKAVSDYDAAGREHADGRASFTAMVSSMRGEDSAEAMTFQARRAAYRANCHLWGTQTGVFFSQCIFRRMDTGVLKGAKITVKRDFRRLRTDAMPISYGWGAVNPNGELVNRAEVPIDADAAKEFGIPLLPEFCSTPIPRFGKPEIRNGWQVQFMLGDQIGKMGAIDLAIGVCRDETPIAGMSDGRKLAYTGFSNRVPTELAVVEFLTHRPSFGIVQPLFRVIPEMSAGLAAELERPTTKILTFEQVQNLGPFAGAPPVSELRDYTRMTRRALEHLDWNESEFDVHRVVIQYPLLSTISGLYFDLNDK